MEEQKIVTEICANNISSFISSVTSGTIGNIVFALILLYVVQRFRYWYYLKRKFHDKEFYIYWKGYSDTNIDSPVLKATCKVRKNVIKFVGKRIADDNEFNGEFIMNPFSLKSAEGFHYHNGYDGFNFPKMMIKDDNTFFVESHYVNVTKDSEGQIKRSIEYQAFVWKRK